MLLLLLLLLIGFLLLRILWHRWKSTAKIPPGGLGFPLIGETVEFLSANNSGKGFYHFVQTRRLRYGNCFKTNIFGRTHVFFSSMESAKTILSNESVNFTKRYITSIAELVGDQSVLCASQEQHRLIRNRLSDLLSTESTSSFIKHFDELVVKTLSSWEQRGSTVVVLDDAMMITFKAMCKMLMNLERLDELEVLQKDVAQVCEGMLGFPLKLPFTRFYKGLKARERVMDKLKKLINLRREKEEKEEEEYPHKDSLHFLLKKDKSSDNDPMLTDSQIQDNILTMIIAGQMTTASAMTWMVKYLDDNQDVLETLRSQQLQLEEKTPLETSLTLEHLNQMTYASKVVKESLRMASVVAWFPRVALTDCEIQGFMIKKGWIVNVDARSIHLDPTVYHDPTTFHPGRFQDESKPHSFLAFGTGGRTCLGMNLAKAMMLVFLHRLITTYRWKVMDSDTSLEKQAIFSTLRSGCPVCVTRFTPNNYTMNEQY